MVPREMLLALITARLRENPNFDAIQDTIALLMDTAAKSQEDLGRVLMLAQNLDHLITQRVTVGPAPSWATREEQAGQPLFTEVPPIIAAITTSPLGVLVGRRNDGKPPWTFISGEQDAVQDESPQDTAIRETKEETGLRIVPGDVIGERDHPKTGRHMIYVSARPAPRASLDVAVEDTEELAEVRWGDLTELDDLMGAGNIFGPVREHLARELGEG